jgi:hypothetical protein
VSRCSEAGSLGKPWTIPVVIREDKGDVAIVKIRRPKVVNALNEMSSPN